MDRPPPTILLANHAGDDWSALELVLRARGFRVARTASLRATLSSLGKERPDLLVFAPLLDPERESQEAKRLGTARSAGAEPGVPPVPLLLVLEPDAPFASLSSFEAAVGPLDGLARRPLTVEQAVFEIERILRHADDLRRLRDQSIRDYGTGLFNHRHLLDERLPEEFQRARRRGHPLSLLLIDLDDFKKLNTETSYPFANEVLASFAKTLLQEKRREDIAFRYGGDEFILLLPETDQTNALAAAERVRAAIRRSVDLGSGRMWSVTTSIGGATYYPPAKEGTRDATPPVRLIERANEALKEAKKGKDCVRFYREPAREASPPSDSPTRKEGRGGRR
ncbi:MAG TPA: GGDEF domain-containing protein [Planctomycetota bacterium]|nr:GGDEF domain-containing protein [Planctomycetota bacterium]